MNNIKKLISLFQAQAQCLPLNSPIPQAVSPCQQVASPSSPVVATTVIDNSVSNALANALQLLIVSNLIENTMNTPCGGGYNTLPSIGATVCESFPITASVYSPAIDVITPSYVPFDPIPVSPCDVITPCEPIIEIIPNNCYPEVIAVPNSGCGCGGGCNGCDGYGPNFGPNFGSNFGPNFGPNFGCGNCLSSLSAILPNLFPNIGLPGCGGRNFGYDMNPFGPSFGCDQCGPFGPDMFPAMPAQVSYGYGMPNLPIAVSVDPYGYDSCPNRGFGNGFY